MRVEEKGREAREPSSQPRYINGKVTAEWVQTRGESEESENCNDIYA